MVEQPHRSATDVGSYVDLADYRRRVAENYAATRAAPTPEEGWLDWRRHRDALFARHPQSPLDPEVRSDEYSVPFAPYDPEYRVTGGLRPGGGDAVAIAHGDGAATRFSPVGEVNVSLPDGDIELTVYWLEAYGGGLFLPFQDATSGKSTYEGGRYLLDTVKGADLATWTEN